MLIANKAYLRKALVCNTFEDHLGPQTQRLVWLQGSLIRAHIAWLKGQEAMFIRCTFSVTCCKEVQVKCLAETVTKEPEADIQISHTSKYALFAAVQDILLGQQQSL